MNKQTFSRRDFLRAGTVLLTAASVAPGLAQDPTRKLRFGFIGVGGRGTYLLGVTLRFPAAEVTAVCDLDPKRVENAAGLVEKARGKRPAGYSAGPMDYRNLLAREDVDAVLIGTPMPLHGPMSVDALRAGKHVLCEVAAAMTLQECHDLVRETERSGKIYMLAENCCYYRQNLVVQQMIAAGLFGDLTFAECGYVHDCRNYLFEPDGTLTWRGQMARDLVGNLYPTHALGPVAQWLGINRGDRLVSLTATSTSSKSSERFVSRKFKPGQRGADTRFAVGDSTTTLIRTANGAVIDLRYDTHSARPHPSTTYFTLQGLSASYKDDGTAQSIWLEGKTKQYAWEPLANYSEIYEHPLWKRSREEALKTGHGGADYFVISEFLNCVSSGRPAPIDAYDAAAWSAIVPLSAASIRAGGAPQEVPDFTRGAWRERKAS